jgi:predicted nucleotidyltransferase
MSNAASIFNVKHPDAACELPDGMILLGYRGSIAHNMHSPSADSIDDIDLMGFVIGGPEHYFGLHEWGSRGTREIKQGRYDCVFYELRKAVSLLLQGNPNIVSMLWVRQEHYLYRSPEGRQLIENRNLFVGKHVYNSFAGYAHAQLLKMERLTAQEIELIKELRDELRGRGIDPSAL